MRKFTMENWYLLFSEPKRHLWGSGYAIVTAHSAKDHCNCPQCKRRSGLFQEQIHAAKFRHGIFPRFIGRYILAFKRHGRRHRVLSFQRYRQIPGKRAGSDKNGSGSKQVVLGKETAVRQFCRTANLYG